MKRCRIALFVVSLAGIGLLPEAIQTASAGREYNKNMARRDCFSRANRVVPALQDARGYRRTTRLSPEMQRLSRAYDAAIARCEAMPRGSTDPTR